MSPPPPPPTPPPPPPTGTAPVPPTTARVVPPPPPVLQDGTNVVYHADDEQSDDEAGGLGEATPLVSHRRENPKKYGQKIFRPTAAAPGGGGGGGGVTTKYSTISEGDASKEGSSMVSGTPAGGGGAGGENDDDDDRSISTAASISSLSTVSTLALENFREGLATPFTDDEGSWDKIRGGLASLAVVGTVVGLLIPKNQELQGGRMDPYYRYLSSVIGYNYFVLWSVCFYPQVLLNARRKSTKGLSNDFAVLNFMGWAFYSSYMTAMFFDATIREMYQERFQGESSVQSNDVLFAIHAMILSFIYLVQIVYYGNRKKSCARRLKLKPQTWVLVLGMGIPTLVFPLLISFGFLGYERWLDYFYVLSFFKIICTLTKYSKQVWLNWSRKSTKGWNIWYNFLECSGGFLSMLQIVLDSYDMRDMSGITGNLAKFALGLATLFFDAIFFTQHYVLYPHDPTEAKKETGGDDDNGHSAAPATGIPRHIRASSRFEIPNIDKSESLLIDPAGSDFRIERCISELYDSEQVLADTSFDTGITTSTGTAPSSCSE